MMFDNPYIHLGQGGICWEVLMTASNYAGATLSLDLAQNALARNLTYGTGCGGVALAGSYVAPNLTLNATGLTPNVPCFLMVGVDDEHSGGVPLPLDLAVLNAPGYSGGTGIFHTTDNRRICYNCAAAEKVRQLHRDGCGVLYLTVDGQGKRWLTDWPGRVHYPVTQYSKSTGYGFGRPYDIETGRFTFG